MSLRNASRIQGEPETGYENEDGLGEFECENCKFFKSGGCSQPNMKQYSKQPRLADGRVKVEPEGCCEYVHRVGRKDKD